MLDPDRDGDRPDAASLPFQVSHHPTSFPQLDGFDNVGFGPV